MRLAASNRKVNYSLHSESVYGLSISLIHGCLDCLVKSHDFLVKSYEL